MAKFVTLNLHFNKQTSNLPDLSLIPFCMTVSMRIHHPPPMMATPPTRDVLLGGLHGCAVQVVGHKRGAVVRRRVHGQFQPLADGQSSQLLMKLAGA